MRVVHPRRRFTRVRRAIPIGAFAALVTGCGALLGVDELGYRSGDGGSSDDAAVSDVRAADVPISDASSADAVSPDASPIDAPQPCGGGYLYVVGGTPTGDPSDAVAEVIAAPIACDGSLGAWNTTLPQMPGPLSHHSAGILGDTLVTFAGYWPQHTAGVFSATLTNGTISAWQSDLVISGVPRWRVGGAVAGGRLFVVGGRYDPRDASAYSTIPWVTAVSGSGSTITVSDAGTLPADVERTAVASTGTMLFAVGGFPEPAQVLVADVGSGGTLGAWRSAGSQPYDAGYMAVGVYGSTLLVFGGEFHADVFTADFSSAGVLGPWTQHAPLPKVHEGSTAVVFGDHVYLVGGTSNSLDPAATLDEVWIGELGAGGLIGDMRLAGHLPKPVAYAVATASPAR